MNKQPLSDFLSPRYWPTWLGLGLLRVLSWVPLSILSGIGRAIGLLLFQLRVPRRAIVLRNLQSCFPEKTHTERVAIARRHFKLLGQAALMTPAQIWMSKKRVRELVTITDRRSYDEALAARRNIIILAPHFLALDIVGPRLSQEREMVTMYQYAKNKLMDQIVIRGRTRFGGEVVERKEPMRKLLKLIRKGYPFYYLPDQDAGRKGVFVPFFNDLASTYSMLGKFAKMTDAVVLPFRTSIKDDGLGFEGEFAAPMSNFPSGDEQQDTRRMNEEIESLVRKDIAQYFWVHKRFKTRPPQERESGTKFYK